MSSNLTIDDLEGMLRDLSDNVARNKRTQGLQTVQKTPAAPLWTVTVRASKGSGAATDWDIDFDDPTSARLVYSMPGTNGYLNLPGTGNPDPVRAVLLWTATQDIQVPAYITVPAAGRVEVKMNGIWTDFVASGTLNLSIQKGPNRLCVIRKTGTTGIELLTEAIR